MYMSEASRFIPKVIPKKKLPPPGERNRVTVNKEVGVEIRFPSSIDRIKNGFKPEILSINYNKRVMITHTVRIHKQFEGDEQYFLFRCYNKHNTGFVLAFHSGSMRWELLYYDF